MESENGMAEAIVDKRAMHGATAGGVGNVSRELRPAQLDGSLMYEEKGSGARRTFGAAVPVPRFVEMPIFEVADVIEGLNPMRRLRELGPQDFA